MTALRKEVEISILNCHAQFGAGNQSLLLLRTED